MHCYIVNNTDLKNKKYWETLLTESYVTFQKYFPGSKYDNIINYLKSAEVKSINLNNNRQLEMMVENLDDLFIYGICKKRELNYTTLLPWPNSLYIFTQLAFAN